jgi:hypothetical protein
MAKVPPAREIIVGIERLGAEARTFMVELQLAANKQLVRKKKQLNKAIVFPVFI